MKQLGGILAAVLLWASPLAAQPVQQSGSITPGHAVRWVTNGVIGDAGTAAAGTLSSIGVTNNGGPGVCVNSGPITSLYNSICLQVGPTTGGQIVVTNHSGATGGFQFILNGVAQGLATVNLPVTANEATCFADASGTLKACGTSGAGSVILVSQYAVCDVVTFTGNTNGTTTVSNVSSVTGLHVGKPIGGKGTGIPAGTTITAIGSTTITLSHAAANTTTGSTLFSGTDDTAAFAGALTTAANAAISFDMEFPKNAGCFVWSSDAIANTYPTLLQINNAQAPVFNFNGARLYSNESNGLSTDNQVFNFHAVNYPIVSDYYFLSAQGKPSPFESSTSHFWFNNGTVGWTVNGTMDGGHKGHQCERPAASGSLRSHGGRANLTAIDVYYPIEHAYDCDDVIVNIREDNAGRPIVNYGNSGVELFVDSKNATSQGVVTAVGEVVGNASQESTTQAKIHFVDNRGSTTCNIVPLELTWGQTTAPAVGRMYLDFWIDIDQTSCGTPYDTILVTQSDGKAHIGNVVFHQFNLVGNPTSVTAAIGLSSQGFTNFEKINFVIRDAQWPSSTRPLQLGVGSNSCYQLENAYAPSVTIAPEVTPPCLTVINSTFANATFSGSALATSKNLIPVTTNTGQVGTAAQVWADGYFTSLHVAGVPVSSGITALTGDVTATGPGSVAATIANGAVTNAKLANAATTVNGVTCTLGSTCTISASAGTITVGVTTIASGTTTRVLYDNAGALGEYTNTQLTALINPATTSLSGALPAWPNTTTTFFRGDGTYQTLNCAAISGSGTGCSAAAGITALTGDVTATGPGSTAATIANSAVTNAKLANAATTVNGQTCTLGSTCTVTSVASSVVVGTTAISGGTTLRVLYDNAGVFGEYTNTQLTALINPATASLPGALPAWPNTITTFFRGDGTYQTLNCAALAGSGTGCSSAAGITALTGDVTATGPGSVAATIANGAVTNAKLANSATTVNGQTCTLGSTCTVTAAATSVTVGSTTIGSGTTTRVLYDNAGALGEYTNTQLTALINPATTSLSGALPAWPNTTTTFFRGDGTYQTLNCAAISGSGSGCSAAAGITALTGDVTATGPGSVAATIANGAVTNAKLANSATTVNGVTCTLGSTCTIAAAASLIVGTTTIAGGTTTRVLYDNAGALGEYTNTQLTALINTATSSLTGAVPATSNTSALVTSSSGVPSWASSGIAGNCLASNGTGSAPTFQACLPGATVFLVKDYAACDVVTFTGNTNGTTTISSVSSVAGLTVGKPVGGKGTGIPAGTTISAIGSTTITLSNAAANTTTGSTLFSGTDDTAAFATTLTTALNSAVSFDLEFPKNAGCLVWSNDTIAAANTTLFGITGAQSPIFNFNGTIIYSNESNNLGTDNQVFFFVTTKYPTVRNYHFISAQGKPAPFESSTSHFYFYNDTVGWHVDGIMDGGHTGHTCERVAGDAIPRSYGGTFNLVAIDVYYPLEHAYDCDNLTGYIREDNAGRPIVNYGNAGNDITVDSKNATSQAVITAVGEVVGNASKESTTQAKFHFMDNRGSTTCNTSPLELSWGQTTSPAVGMMYLDFWIDIDMTSCGTAYDNVMTMASDGKAHIGNVVFHQFNLKGNTTSNLISLATVAQGFSNNEKINFVVRDGKFPNATHAINIGAGTSTCFDLDNVNAPGSTVTFPDGATPCLTIVHSQVANSALASALATSKNIVPITNNTNSVGTSANNFSDGYFGNFHVTGTLTLTSPLAVTGGGTGLSSTTINQLLYSSSANTIAGLATANNGVLVTSSGGVPSISSTIPNATQDNITRTGTLVSGATGSGFTLAFGSSTLTGQIPLANGGTAANLTASNGGIFYSTASAGAILSATATARQMLQSGASGAPAWSTTTWPATTTVNRLLWTSATNVISDLATANSSILVTDGSGVPSLSTTLPAHTLGGTVSGGGNQINNVIIGNSTPLAGTFTNLTMNGTAAFSGSMTFTSAVQDVVGIIGNGAVAETALYIWNQGSGGHQWNVLSSSAGTGTPCGSGGVSLYDGSAGAVRFCIDNAGGAYTTIAGKILGSKTTITGGSTGNVPTLTAGPANGNPTKWLPYDDNGTTRYIPAW